MILSNRLFQFQGYCRACPVPNDKPRHHPHYFDTQLLVLFFLALLVGIQMTGDKVSTWTATADHTDKN